MVASFKTPAGQKRIYSAKLLGMLLVFALPFAVRAEACAIPPPIFTIDEPYQARFHDPRLTTLIARRRPFIKPRLDSNVTAAWSGRPTMERR